MRKKSAAQLLQAAAGDAVRLLVETMNDPEQPVKLRKECAELVLERVYGRSPLPGEGAGAAIAGSETDAHKALEALGYVRK